MNESLLTPSILNERMRLLQVLTLRLLVAPPIYPLFLKPRNLNMRQIMTEPVRLFPLDQCVVCWHGPHPKELCKEIEYYPLGIGNHARVIKQKCMCDTYKTEEDRGKIIVPRNSNAG